MIFASANTCSAAALSLLLCTSTGAVVFGCGGDEPAKNGNASSSGSANTNPDVTAGATTYVAIVNPVVNTGHSTGSPSSLGSERDAIPVAIQGAASVNTAEGIAVLPVPVGPTKVGVGAASLDHTVSAEGDVYDAPIALSGSNAAHFSGTPIRYAVGKASGAVYFAPTDGISSIEAKLADDDVVVVLRPGVYKGSLRITGKGALLFGEGFRERAVTIDGSVTADGEQVRLRGLTITGDSRRRATTSASASRSFAGRRRSAATAERS